MRRDLHPPSQRPKVEINSSCSAYKVCADLFRASSRLFVLSLLSLISQEAFALAYPSIPHISIRTSAAAPTTNPISIGCGQCSEVSSISTRRPARNTTILDTPFHSKSLPSFQLPLEPQRFLLLFSKIPLRSPGCQLTPCLLGL